MKKLSPTATLAFYNARSRKGDAKIISDKTGYSYSHVINMINGIRTIQTPVASKLYNISKNRTKNSELV